MTNTPTPTITPTVSPVWEPVLYSSLEAEVYTATESTLIQVPWDAVAFEVIAYGAGGAGYVGGGAGDGTSFNNGCGGGGGGSFMTAITTNVPLPPQDIEGWYPGKIVDHPGALSSVPDYEPGVGIGGPAYAGGNGDSMTKGGDGLVVIRFIPYGIIWDQTPED